MCRPSDIAPKVGFFRDQIKFNEDGSMTVRFFGIKNDVNKTGFEVRIAGTDDVNIDPVVCLRHYLTRTDECVKQHSKQPVFIALKYPWRGLNSSAIAAELSATLEDAGLRDKFTPRSFRPSAITGAVLGGADAQTVRVQARIKTQSVFFDNYKYPISDKSLMEQTFKSNFPG